jgi:hypothetical protein
MPPPARRPLPQAARLELQRTRQLHPYFPRDPTSSGVRPPGEPPGLGFSWQSYACLMHPLLDKSPWLAAWDRTLRTLLRFDLRSGGLRGASALQDAFEAAARSAAGGGAGALGAGAALGEAELEGALRSLGVGRAEMGEHLAAAAAAAAAAAGQGRPAAAGAAPRRPQRTLQEAAPPPAHQQAPGRGGTAEGGGKGAGKAGRAGARAPSSLGVAGEGGGEEGCEGEGPALALGYQQFVQLVMLGPGAAAAAAAAARG